MTYWNDLVTFLCQRDQYANEQKIFEKMNGKGRGGKYLEKKNIFFCRAGQERKSERWRIFREGKLMVTSQHNQLGDYIAMRLFEC